LYNLYQKVSVFYVRKPLLQLKQQNTGWIILLIKMF